MQYNSKNQQESLFVIKISEEYCSEQTDSTLTDVMRLVLGAYKRKYIKDTCADQSEKCAESP